MNKKQLFLSMMSTLLLIGNEALARDGGGRSEGSRGGGQSRGFQGGNRGESREFRSQEPQMQSSQGQEFRGQSSREQAFPEKRDQEGRDQYRVQQERDNDNQFRRNEGQEQGRDQVREQQNRDSDNQFRRNEGQEQGRDQVREQQSRDNQFRRDGGNWQRDRFSKDEWRNREMRWSERGNQWRRGYPDYRDRHHIFDDYYWGRFRNRYNNWYFDNRFQWYVGPTWGNVIVWFPWQWSRPVYYYYEPSGAIYYSTTEDFTDLTPIDSRANFITEAVRIANAPRQYPSNQADWMALGTFVLASSDNDTQTMPQKYLSLALSKDGAVTGAYFDVENNDTFQIQGGVDPDSQRIAWKFVGQDWPVMESALYNLTKDTSTLLIHPSADTTQTLIITRLQQQ